MDMDLVEGMRFDKGYIAPYFVTDPERMEAVLEDAYILLVGSKITAVRDLLPVLEKVMQSGKPLADHRRGRRGRGPGHPGGQQDPRHLPARWPSRPPASASAARPCSRTSPSSPAARSSPRRSASSWRTSTLDLLGSARKVVVTKDETTIVEGAGSETDIKGRINQIKTEIENTDSDYDREKLQERLAKLSGGVAVIKVGAATEVELKEKKHRIEDAVSTTKAAIEEGVVPGGGVALLRAQTAILERAEKLEGDEATGARIVARAVEEPLKQIAVNAGLEGGVIVEKVRNLKGCRRPQRRHRRVRGPLQGRRHRRRQGDPLGPAERRVHRGAVPHHRGGHRRQARGRGARPCPAAGWTTSRASEPGSRARCHPDATALQQPGVTLGAPHPQPRLNDAPGHMAGRIVLPPVRPAPGFSTLTAWL